LPFRICYLFSDLLSLLLIYLIPYRKRLILNQLRKSLPDRSEREIQSILRGFYRHLLDLFFEGIKMSRMSEATMRKRMKVEGVEAKRKYFDQGKSVIAVMGHYTNWEWGAGLGHRLKERAGFDPYTIYKQIRNPYFNQYFNRVRSRFGFRLLEMRESMGFYQDEKNPTITVFIADQSPAVPRRAIWVDFLGQKTAFHSGPELLARRYDLPVLYARFERVKRGHYVAYLEDLWPEPKQSEKGEITQAWVAALEKQIRQDPVYWLWSHNRWKHAPPQ
jgi:KDO2-lipid IV(A) lauroyltransferase